MTAPPDLAAEVLAHLRQLEAKGSPGLVTQVLAVFLRDTATRLSALRDGVARYDAAAVVRTAHTLQGSAAMIGASSVARQCIDLINAARRGDFDRCEAILADLIVSFEAIQRAVADQ